MDIEHDDIIDLRQLADQLRELLTIDEADRSEDERDAIAELTRFAQQEVTNRSGELSPEDAADELQSHADNYEPALIADAYFEDYARELAQDIGATSGNEQWPLSYIDWPAAANALQQDYASVTLDGREYWIRTC